MAGTRYYLGGGIGSGKSAAGLHFSELGAVVLSGDDAGREVLAPGTPETAVVLRRWPEAKSGDGGIDRRVLGRIVFRDAGELAALERITGSGIRARLVADADSRGAAIVMVEVPVLRDFAGPEWPWIVVDAPDDQRVARATRRGGGMSGMSDR
jgi:dephospho-CoA kinase